VEARHVEIKVLGPLEARENDTSVLPTAAKPRQIFTLLALAAGSVVPTFVLMEELWSGVPPRTASTTLQTYILQLRRRIEAATGRPGRHSSKDVLRTGSNGYVLEVDPEDIDINWYERLAAAGRAAFAAGFFEQASLLLRQALAVWRGPALVDLPFGSQLRIEVTRLEENRLDLLQQRIDADLCLGRHQAVLGELAALCGKYPWHEDLAARYMVALYRSGRRPQALGVYHKLRGQLVNEYGLEPSSRLQHLHSAILADAPNLDEPSSNFLKRPIA
jgi:SARP family transcriptional regulator, regulator of embCAB operon